MFTKLLLDLAYVGTKGTKLSGGRDLNQAVARRRLSAISSIRAYCDYRASCFSSYHALQTRVERELSPGQALLAAYTWSKSIDDASSLLGWLTANLCSRKTLTTCVANAHSQPFTRATGLS